MKLLSLVITGAVILGGISPAMADHRVDSDCLGIDCSEYDRNTYILKTSTVKPGDVYYDYRNSDMDYEVDYDMEVETDDDKVIKGGF